MPMTRQYSVRADNFSASAQFPQPLPEGLYRVTLTTALADRSQNPLPSSASWEFRVGNASYWAGPFAGSWNDPANWSSGVVPRAEDDVVVDVSFGDGHVALDGPARARNLEVFDELEIARGANLEADSMTAHRDLRLDGGQIRNAALTLREGALLRPGAAVGGTLERVTINGNILTAPGTWLEFLGGLTLNGTLTNAGGAVTFGDSQTVTAGTIEFAGNPQSVNVTIAQGTTVIWGPGVSVRGRGGIISGAGTLLNQGTILAETPGERVFVHPGLYTHDGRAEVLEGSELIFGDSGGNPWNGSGSVEVQQGTLNLSGRFGPVGIRITKGPAGVVRLTGQADLQGSSLTLNAATGSWVLDGGTLRGGILNLVEGAALTPVGNVSILEQMTVHGNLTGSLNFRGGLSLHGTLLLGTNQFVRFQDSQTLTNGTIEFAGPRQGSAVPAITLADGAAVTFGPAILVHGRSGTISGAGRLINQGTLAADIAGNMLTIRSAQFENPGTIRADGAATTVVIRVDPFTNTGTMEELNGGQILVNP